MGQRASTFLVSVRDVNGRPMAGAVIESYSDGRLLDAKDADGNGDAVLAVEIPSSLRIQYGKHVLWQQIPARKDPEETVFVQFPVCVPGPILTMAEIIGLLGGAAITAGGFFWKHEALKLGGEVLVGAAAFTAIYRHSCL
jgi:hypothetical protein